MKVSSIPKPCHSIQGKTINQHPKIIALIPEIKLKILFTSFTHNPKDKLLFIVV